VSTFAQVVQHSFAKLCCFFKLVFSTHCIFYVDLSLQVEVCVITERGVRKKKEIKNKTEVQTRKKERSSSITKVLPANRSY
jgi:hypothetical protein